MNFSIATALEIGIEAGKRLLVEEPAWLWAVTINVAERVGLLVYRSVMVRSGDPIYQPVKEFIESCPGLEFVGRITIADRSMIFGQATLTLFLEQDGKEGDSGMIAEMRAAGVAIVNEFRVRGISAGSPCQGVGRLNGERDDGM